MLSRSPPWSVTAVPTEPRQIIICWVLPQPRLGTFAGFEGQEFPAPAILCHESWEMCLCIFRTLCPAGRFSFLNSKCLSKVGRCGWRTRGRWEPLVGNVRAEAAVLLPCLSRPELWHSDICIILSSHRDRDSEYPREVPGCCVGMVQICLSN